MSDTPRTDALRKTVDDNWKNGGFQGYSEDEWLEKHAELESELAQIQSKLAETGRERDHWKANHDTQVRRTGLLAERHDLPVDRLPAYREMERLQSKLAEAEREKKQANEAVQALSEGKPLGPIVCQHTIQNMALHIANLEAELKTERENGAKLLADAKRYRKIRQHRPQWYCSFITECGYRSFHGKELDEQVDALGASHADE